MIIILIVSSFIVWILAYTLFSLASNNSHPEWLLKSFAFLVWLWHCAFWSLRADWSSDTDYS